MWSRLAGRLVTSPLAFLAAGVYDFSAFFAAYARQQVRARVRAAVTGPGPRPRGRP